MFYTIYKITNLLDGKIYIGSHKTKKLDDKYMGSGKYLKAAQKKYGMENFKKELLFVFDNPEEMYAKEAKLVNEEFLVTENTYNLKVGGFGGWDFVNSEISYETRVLGGKRGGAVYAERLKSDDEFRIADSTKKSTQRKSEYSSGARKKVFTVEFNKAQAEKAWSEESSRKRAATRKQNSFQVKEKNSQFGTTIVWHELIGNKRIKKDMLVDYLDQGWHKTYKPGYRVESTV